jgi:hypothetical protein
MARPGKRSEMLLAEIDRNFVRMAPGRVPSRLLAQAFFEGRPPMTRGRQLDAVTLRHLSLVTKQWRGRRVDRPIFVVGIGRSGTTLLGRVLASGKGVGYLKEPKAMWHRALADEDISGFYSATGRFVLNAADATPAVQDDIRAMFNWFATLTRSTRLVDKYPEMTYRVPFLRALFPDAKIIGIVRRPESVVQSIVRYSEEMADDRGDWWGVDSQKWTQMYDQLILRDAPAGIPAGVDERTSDPATRALCEWVLGASALRDSSAEVDHIVRFESLLKDPESTLRDLCEICELDGTRIVRYGVRTIGSAVSTGESKLQDSALTGLLAGFGYEDARP